MESIEDELKKCQDELLEIADYPDYLKKEAKCKEIKQRIIKRDQRKGGINDILEDLEDE